MSSGTTQHRPTVPMTVIITSRGRTRNFFNCLAFVGATNRLNNGTNSSGKTLSIPKKGTPDSINSSFNRALPNGPLRIEGFTSARSSWISFTSHSTGIPPQRRVLKLVSFLRTKISVFIDSAREQVLHQTSLDALLLGYQGFGLFNGLVYRREYFGDFGLFGFLIVEKRKSAKDFLVNVRNTRASRLALEIVFPTF